MVVCDNTHDVFGLGSWKDRVAIHREVGECGRRWLREYLDLKCPVLTGLLNEAGGWMSVCALMGELGTRKTFGDHWGICWRRKCNTLQCSCLENPRDEGTWWGAILKEISPGCSLEGLKWKLKLQYFGHLMQKADSFEKTLMPGKIESRRRRG